MNVYERFCQEVDALVIAANQPAVSVVGELTLAVKRAQMVVDGELRPLDDNVAQLTCVRCRALMPDPSGVSRGMVCGDCIVKQIRQATP